MNIYCFVFESFKVKSMNNSLIEDKELLNKLSIERHEWMSKSYSQCKSVNDIANWYIKYYKSEISYCPAHVQPLYQETQKYSNKLVEMTKYGFITTCSQNGIDGEIKVSYYSHTKDFGYIYGILKKTILQKIKPEPNMFFIIDETTVITHEISFTVPEIFQIMPLRLYFDIEVDDSYKLLKMQYQQVPHRANYAVFCTDIIDQTVNKTVCDEYVHCEVYDRKVGDNNLFGRFLSLLKQA